VLQPQQRKLLVLPKSVLQPPQQLLHLKELLQRRQHRLQQCQKQVPHMCQKQVPHTSRHQGNT
jgi:hypothetical protein